jgi:hypothetical protein
VGYPGSRGCTGARLRSASAPRRCCSRARCVWPPADRLRIRADRNRSGRVLEPDAEVAGGDPELSVVAFELRHTGTKTVRASVLTVLTETSVSPTAVSWIGFDLGLAGKTSWREHRGRGPCDRLRLADGRVRARTVRLGSGQGWPGRQGCAGETRYPQANQARAVAFVAVTHHPRQWAAGRVGGSHPEARVCLVSRTCSTLARSPS